MNRCSGLLLMMSIAGCASAQQRSVWQIGKFDDSSQEFRDQNIDYSSAASDLVYTVGSSKDADWIRFQPGPANAIAGGRLHPFRINFALNEPPRGVYRLRVAVLYETPRLSALELNINGHKGLFYFHPKLDFAAGDFEGTFVPQTSRDEKTIDIPARWLQRGENSFVLAAIDAPALPQNSKGNIAPGQSGLVYDALSLTQDAAARYPEGVVSELTVPTIFYQKSADGLDEVVDVFPQLNDGAMTTGNVTLTVAGRQFSRPLTVDGDFGEAKVRFTIPEWSGSTPATVQIGGHSFPENLAAGKKWTLDIVPGEHLDIGYTDYRPKVAELQAQSIDGVLGILQQHPNFRWTLDGSWAAQQYLAGRSEARQKQFLDAVRAGEIVIPPQLANMHTGVASLEELVRSLYPSHELAAKYHLPIGAAHITDVPSFSWSYASVLHDSGMKYLAAGSNSWRAPIMLLGRWTEKSPFYWEGPDGGRVMMWYSRCYLQLASLFGTPPTLSAVEDAAPVFLQAYTRADYVANSAIVYGTQLENTPLDPAQAGLPEQWAGKYAWPKMVFTTFQDAMSSLDRQFDGKLPVYRGDFGPYWEDGFGSDALHTAIYRRSQQRILTAEKMSTVPALLNPELRPDTAKLADAWYNMLLFDEHTWTAANSATQPEGDQALGQLRQKQMQALIAQNDISETVERSWAQIESLLRPEHDSIAVFNSLSWTRSGWVEADLPAGQAILDPTTNKLAEQVVLKQEGGSVTPGFGSSTNRVRFRANNVPMVGYKLFEIVPLADDTTLQPHSDGAAVRNHVIENHYYRVTLDPEHGAIASIFDKQLHRELVDRTSPFRLGEYVYVEGGDDVDDSTLSRFGAAQHLPTLRPMPAGHGHVVGISETAQGVTAVLESSAPNTPSIRTEITLRADQKRIDFDYGLHKDRTLRKEAAYIAFPLAGDHPTFRYETQNGYVNPAQDELAGGSREWYAVGHWAAMSSGGVTTAILPEDAPLVAFGDIVRGKWPTKFEPGSSAIFSWIMSNYWDTNFPASQGGDFDLHYALVSAPEFDAGELTRLGWESMTHLESDPVHPDASAGASGGALAQDAASFLSIDQPDVVLTAWKLAEDGDGSIVRVEDTAGKAVSIRIGSQYLRFTRAWLCDALEDKLRELPVSSEGLHLSVPAFGVVTVRIETEPRSGS
jgi:alpha-mannosidase